MLSWVVSAPEPLPVPCGVDASVVAACVVACVVGGWMVGVWYGSRTWDDAGATIEIEGVGCTTPGTDDTGATTKDDDLTPTVTADVGAGRNVVVCKTVVRVGCNE